MANEIRDTQVVQVAEWENRQVYNTQLIRVAEYKQARLQDTQVVRVIEYEGGVFPVIADTYGAVI